MSTITVWDKSFNACVILLEWMAKKLNPYWPGGMDYVKINVILFCIILPIILIGLTATNVWLILALLG